MILTLELKGASAHSSAWACSKLPRYAFVASGYATWRNFRGSL